jgi:hypothetical protein
VHGPVYPLRGKKPIKNGFVTAGVTTYPGHREENADPSSRQQNSLAHGAILPRRP